MSCPRLDRSADCCSPPPFRVAPHPRAAGFQRRRRPGRRDQVREEDALRPLARRLPHRPSNSGVTCRVKRHGEFYVLRYKNPKRGIRYLRNWVMSDHDFIAQEGKILVVPAGPGEWYKRASARYAAKRLHGHVVRLS